MRTAFLMLCLGAMAAASFTLGSAIILFRLLLSYGPTMIFLGVIGYGTWYIVTHYFDRATATGKHRVDRAKYSKRVKA